MICLGSAICGRAEEVRIEVRVTGDKYAGETFRQDFQGEGIAYHVSELTKWSAPRRSSRC